MLTHVNFPSVEKLHVPVSHCLSSHLHWLCWWGINNSAATGSSLVSVVVMKKKRQLKIHSLVRSKKQNDLAGPNCSFLMCDRRRNSCNNPLSCPSTEHFKSGDLRCLWSLFYCERKFFSSWLLAKKKPSAFLGVWVSLPRLILWMRPQTGVSCLWRIAFVSS